MIVCHKHRFIFIKTSKTAGTSIEIALSRFCGPDDIVTRNSPEDEALRQELGCPGPQNHYLPLSDYTASDWKQLVFKGKRPRFTSHQGAFRIRQLVGDKVWNNYYKFCFERNPWDRCVSLYYHFLQDKKLKNLLHKESISGFIDNGFPLRLRKRGIDLYSIGNEIAVDRVCLFENLEAELEFVCNHTLGIAGQIDLPRAKGGFRKDRRHYRDILNTADREKIRNMFAQEIDLFGYCF